MQAHPYAFLGSYGLMNDLASMLQKSRVWTEIVHHPEDKLVRCFIKNLEVEVGWHGVLELRLVEKDSGGPAPAAVGEGIG